MINMFKQGITTVRDMAGNGETLSVLKDLGQKKEAPYPKVHFACLITGEDFIRHDSRVTETTGNSEAGNVAWFKVLKNDTDVDQLIDEAQKFGCTGIKLYADIDANDAKRTIATAKNKGIAVWSHGTLVPGGPWDIEGIHSFSHADFLNFVTVQKVPDMQTMDVSFNEKFDLATIQSQKMKDYFALLKKNNTILDATLLVYEDLYPDEFELVTFSHKVTEAAYSHEVKISAGSDVGNDAITKDNFALLSELKLLRDHAKMTPMDLIKAATINNAIGIGIAADYGSIEKGKKADLVLLNKNPLDDIEHIKDVHSVVKDGYEHEF